MSRVEKEEVSNFREEISELIWQHPETVNLDNLQLPACLQHRVRARHSLMAEPRAVQREARKRGAELPTGAGSVTSTRLAPHRTQVPASTLTFSEAPAALTRW